MKTGGRKTLLTAISRIVGLSFIAGAAAGGALAGCFKDLLGSVPARSDSAPDASEFVQRLKTMNDRERDAAVGSELISGNMPAFLRRLVPIVLNGAHTDGRIRSVVICIKPDYLAIGSDRDYLLVPMGLSTALTVAAHFGFILPTRKMVDAIYEQAVARLRPQPLPPGPRMRSIEYTLHHNSLIREQRLVTRVPLGLSTAGHKKDLVVTDALWNSPDRVAIYGWHQASGRPIQPLSTVHGVRYADYSHGVRLVSEVAYLDGEARSIRELLADPSTAAMLSDEGPIRALAIPADRSPPRRD